MAHSRALRWRVSAAGGLVLAVALTASVSATARTAARVRQDTLRLHVQAGSDSPADQRLKLQVRDAVLTEAAAVFADCTDARAACRAARAAIPRFQRAAERTAARAGSRTPVRVQLTSMSFPTTQYRQFSLPPGPYRALRVELGRAHGHNWFCVLYPSLCLPAAQGGAPAAWPAPDEQRLVMAHCQVKFAVLEWWQRLRER